MRDFRPLLTHRVTLNRYDNQQLGEFPLMRARASDE
jgi:hypothetical protein